MLALDPPLEEFAASIVEGAIEFDHEGDRLRRKDMLGTGDPFTDDPMRLRHQPPR